MSGRLLSTTLFVVAAGILAQALTAGFFISGTTEAKLVHIIVAAVLPYLAIVPTVSSWRKSGQGRVSRGIAIGVTLVMVGLWVQEALGHMPFAVTTVIHVPLGVLLFFFSAHLGLGAHRAGV